MNNSIVIGLLALILISGCKQDTSPKDNPLNGLSNNDLLVDGQITDVSADIAIPSGVTAVVTASSINLQWQSVAEADDYWVAWQQDGDLVETVESTSGAISYTKITQPEQIYHFRVSAVKEAVPLGDWTDRLSVSSALIQSSEDSAQ